MDSKSVGLICVVVTILGYSRTVFSNQPPTIIIDRKYFAVSESTNIGTVVNTLKAEDPDPGDSLTFTLISPQSTVNLTVKPKTGNTWSCDVILNKYLDRDTGTNSINLHFTVEDTKQHVVNFKLVMIITDVNDNPPSFTELPYQQTVSENHPLRTSLYKFNSKDPDEGEGGSPCYSMKAKNENEEDEYNKTFKLNNLTGEVQLKKELDYETRSFYHFRVSVKDEGNPPCPGPKCLCRDDEWKDLKGYCNGTVVDFFITVMDEEDTPPIFERIPYVGTVMEDKPVNHTIMTVKATDGDRGVANQSLITYSLSDSGVPFSVNKVGEIMVSRKLDADDENLRRKGGLYLFNVTATEEASPSPNKTSTLVSITVQDSNDNKPEFNSNTFNASVLENTPKGVPLTMTSNIEVKDIDQGTNSRFRIFVESVNGGAVPSFSTNPGEDQILQGSSSVTIVVNDSSLLDFEQTQTVSFKLIAKEVIGVGNDATLGNKRSEATVNVTIEDINDNSPVFHDRNTTFQVPEDSPLGSVIHTFKATDADKGQYGQVVFSLGNEDEKFNITSDGNLTLKSSLDRETRSSYFLVILASDDPAVPESQRRRSQLQVTVQVTDVNDNDPEWNQPLTYFSVSETDTANTTVTVLRASDKDSGVNRELEYSVDQDNDGSLYFDVRKDANGQAELFIKRNLIGHPGVFWINVTAKDKGDEPRESMIPLQIKVVDVNLDPPVFRRPNITGYNESAGILFEKCVKEELPTGSVLYQLYAEDEGKGPNDKVFYYLLPSQDYKYFKVDPSSGKLTSSKRLDRETKEEYVIQVKAEDSGLPAPLSNTISLRIRLLDINDSKPEFSGDKTQTMFVEEEKKNAVIGKVKNATDADEIPQVFYLLCEKTENVTLDKHTGLLSLNGTIDREKIPSIDVRVMASNESETFINCSEAKPDSILNVTVQVKDINDKPPRFSPDSSFSKSILYDTEKGKEVYNLKSKVKDDDIFPNNEFYFELKDISISKNMDTSFGENAFTVSRDGSVKTNILFQSGLLGYFLLEVNVYGNNTRKMNDTAEIKIFIVAKDHRVKLVFSKLPWEVENIIVDMTKKLSTELKLEISHGSIKTHTLEDGTPDAERTDVFIYASERNSNEYISAVKLQAALDSNKYARQLLFNSGVGEASLESSMEEDDSDKELLKRLFVILVTVLAILVVALLLVLFKIIRMYRRRLKAATTMAYSSPKQQEMYEHPGTNKYYTAENPLFGKEIKAPELEEDRNSTNSLDVNAVDTKSSPTMYDHIDGEEEQEVVLQIMDSALSSPQHKHLSNQNVHLNRVLEEYDNSLNQNGKTKPYSNGLGHNRPVNGHPIPGLGQNVLEGVTRFSDEALSNGHGYMNENQEIYTPHGNLQYTEI